MDGVFLSGILMLDGIQDTGKSLRKCQEFYRDMLLGYQSSLRGTLIALFKEAQDLPDPSLLNKEKTRTPL